MSNIPFLGRFLSEPAFLLDGAATALLQPLAVEHPKLKELRNDLQSKPEMREDGIAIMPVTGVLARNPGTMEMLFDDLTDTAVLCDQFSVLAKEPNCKGILLDVDSPGGFVTGGPELADLIKECGKPVVAWTGGMMCSLAYWIGSQARAVVASRSAIVGSIGAYTAIYDATRFLENLGVSVEVIKNKEGKYKAAGLKTLQDDQREQLQQSIQKTFDQFKEDILRCRAVPTEAMQGQTFSGSELKGQNLVDAIGSRSFAMALLRRKIDGEDEDENDD